jgi:hypothetical protein
VVFRNKSKPEDYRLEFSIEVFWKDRLEVNFQVLTSHQEGTAGEGVQQYRCKECETYSSDLTEMRFENRKFPHQGYVLRAQGDAICACGWRISRLFPSTVSKALSAFLAFSKRKRAIDSTRSSVTIHRRERLIFKSLKGIFVPLFDQVHLTCVAETVRERWFSTEPPELR